ncbi:energy transducer TonB [Rufibacter quisquiliarum]|uniref:TonB C-terminal domain-containing protein n=1 Tax=Rufibacter quisquiliarum TaxID=1549639 RepID=A0A839GE53_9BACT|nr:energy transducer TonB [Rufibacter quisquiliarum]MBA9077884.1 hypothetical protein [Rufibacter quisquiliarum]
MLRREIFSKGELVTGECFAEDGKTTIPYYPHFSFPDFPGGPSTLMKLVMTSFKMPQETSRSRVAGTTVVHFIVTKEGKIHSPSIVKYVHPDIDEEVLRVVNTLPNFAPALEEGN